MLSRVAASLYWLSRNIQRAESLARIVDVAFNRTVDRNVAGRDQATAMWRNVLGLVGVPGDADYPGGSRFATDAFALATFSREHNSSIVSCIHIARANATSVRAELSSEAWEAVNALYLFIEKQSPRAVVRAGPSSLLREIRDAGVAFGGIVDATITHGEEWNFLQLGRFIERAAMTTAVLQTHDEADDSVSEWQRILEMCCASEPFARTLRHSTDPQDALDFLLLYRTFPRSVRYCTAEVDQALHRLSETQPGTFSNDAERVTGRLGAMLDYVRLGEIVDDGPVAFARRLSRRLAEIGTAIETTYFPLVPAA
ncbi:MAG: alpha-E domain-containing protein [Candidatus Aquilonibacter sp.]|jgi:uncharacterized alpha-E superfamily protein